MSASVSTLKMKSVIHTRSLPVVLPLVGVTDNPIKALVSKVVCENTGVHSID